MLPTDSTSNIPALSALIHRTMYCADCALHETRICVVPGAGHRFADMMIVGEGPGEQEDREGLPFVGRSGEMLTRTLRKVGLTREDVYITNVVKCRPPNNRDPLPEEVEACRKHLEEQVELIQPKLIVALGRIAAGHLLGRPVKITKEHGMIDVLPWNNDVLVSIIYHPSYVLRNRNTRVEEDFIHDFKEARTIAYGEIADHSLPEGSAG